MGYPKCKECGELMTNATDTDLTSSEFDGIKRIYECDCGVKCQAIYNFEEVTPSDIFWEDGE